MFSQLTFIVTAPKRISLCTDQKSGCTQSHKIFIIITDRILKKAKCLAVKVVHIVEFIVQDVYRSFPALEIPVC